jgi:hypothetical protein
MRRPHMLRSVSEGTERMSKPSSRANRRHVPMVERLSALGLSGEHEGGPGPLIELAQVAAGNDGVDEEPESGLVGGGVEGRERRLEAQRAFGVGHGPVSYTCAMRFLARRSRSTMRARTGTPCR